jgi:1-acyl-sn-glycerol-3-phosphate acyltransferase
MAKSEAFDWHPWIGKFLTAYGVFPIRRGQGDVDAIQFAAELVKGGRILGMFPEGTRSRTGVLRQGKSGVARIALMSQAPVVPGVVLNSLETLKKLGRPWQRPEVYVRFGEPLIFDGDPGNREVVYATLHRIMVETARMMPAQLRGEWGQFVE